MSAMQSHVQRNPFTGELFYISGYNKILFSTENPRSGNNAIDQTEIVNYVQLGRQPVQSTGKRLCDILPDFSPHTHDQLANAVRQLSNQDTDQSYAITHPSCEVVQPHQPSNLTNWLCTCRRKQCTVLGHILINHRHNCTLFAHPFPFTFSSKLFSQVHVEIRNDFKRRPY